MRPKIYFITISLNQDLHFFLLKVKGSKGTNIFENALRFI